jgi:DNA-directed RNA polymerase specialized sigma24 family protein
MLKLLKRTDEREMPMLWLKKTVHSAAMDAGRRHSREARWICALNDGENNKSVCEIADERGYLATGSNHDDSTMDLEDPEPDLISRLKNVLKELTKPLRQVLILHADGYSDRQIAVMTKTKLGTIRSRLHYARKRARCYLGELG